MLQEYEAGKNPQKTVNLLKAIQQTRVAQETSVTQECIKRYQWKSTMIKKCIESVDSTEDTIVVDDSITKRIELQDQIAQLPIKNPLSLDEFLNLKDETVVNKDSDIFTSVVEHYSADKPGQEEQSSDKEEEVEEVDTAKALKAIETVKLWKLQKGDSQDLQALDRIKREITRYKSDLAHQTTILRFFKPK